jgi:preprotein translocase subunit SecG
LIEYLLYGIYILSCFILILFVLLQPGKSDASAIFGGGASSTAFGPRGTQTVLAKVTVGAAIVFFLVAFLFSIPGLFERKSLGQGITNSSAPQQAPASLPETGAVPSVSPAASVSPTTSGSPGAAAPTAPAGAKPAASPAASKAAGR